MILEEQLKSFDSLVFRLKDTIISKGSDYAGEDKLSNFKTAGANCGISPEQQCLSLIATKVARLGTLFNKEDRHPLNESIEDSVKDLINYGILLYMILEEKVDDDLPF